MEATHIVFVPGSREPVRCNAATHEAVVRAVAARSGKMPITEDIDGPRCRYKGDTKASVKAREDACR